MLRSIVILSIITLSLHGCEEPFDLNIQEGPSLLVVNGLITDQPGPYEITLTRTSEFSIQSIILFETEAEVIITDDQGNSERLTEVSPGTYRTDSSGIRGVIGRSYSLSITTLDGEEYESQPDILTAVADIDSLYYELITKPELGIDGHQFFIDLTDPANQRNYYRWTWESVQPLLTLPPPNSPLFCCVSCFQTTFDRLGFNVISDEFNDGQKFARIPIHFEPFGSLSGLLVRIEQYGLSGDAFEFWNSLRLQAENVGSIFDPPPTPIRGNVRNINNPERNALGFFGASQLIRTRIMVFRGADGAVPLFRNNLVIGDCRDFANTTLLPPPDWDN